MRYRVPLENIVIDVPESVCWNDRDKQVLAYDIRIFEEEATPHWQCVADSMNDELHVDETASSVRSCKDRVSRRVQKMALQETVNDNLFRNVIFQDRDRTILDRKEAAQRWLGTEYESTKSPVKNGFKRRICVVSDYHGTIHPFIAESLLKTDYDLCIHAGDILDMWALHQARIEGKSLTNQEKGSTVDEEIQIMRTWFELLDEHTTAQHIVLMGNHDARLYAQFVRLLDPILRSESLLCRMFKTPLDLLVEGLENFTIGSREMEWSYPDGMTLIAAESQYLYQLGDALVSHMNFTGKTPGTAVNKLWSWVQDYRIPLGLTDIRLCLQAHTHSLMLDKNTQGGSVNLVETGCALTATALGYGLVYNGNWAPSSVGYVTFEQNWQEPGVDPKTGSWHTDLNSVQLHSIS